MLTAGFQPFSLSDFPGKSAAIIFTQGCNFHCPYCHNRQLLPLHPKSPLPVTADSILEYLANRRQQLEGVVITGGEPTLQAGLAPLLSQLKEMGFLTKLDTNGSKPDVISELIANGCVDYIAMDIKAPPNKYSQLAGCSVEIHDILASLKIIQESDLRHHFRTTFYTKLLTETDLAEIRQLVIASKHVTQQCQTTGERSVPPRSTLFL